jgi:hypothetical protein
MYVDTCPSDDVISSLVKSHYFPVAVFHDELEEWQAAHHGRAEEIEVQSERFLDSPKAG